MQVQVKLPTMAEYRDAYARAVRVHTPDQPTGFTLGESDTLTAEPVFQGWELSVADLFKS